jgi:hypothetical protein
MLRLFDKQGQQLRDRERLSFFVAASRREIEGVVGMTLVVRASTQNPHNHIVWRSVAPMGCEGGVAPEYDEPDQWYSPVSDSVLVSGRIVAVGSAATFCPCPAVVICAGEDSNADLIGKYVVIPVITLLAASIVSA